MNNEGRADRVRSIHREAELLLNCIEFGVDMHTVDHETRCPQVGLVFT